MVFPHQNRAERPGEVRVSRNHYARNGTHGVVRSGNGEVTDIVEKEMYTFEDKGGDSLTLRPEATRGCLEVRCRAFFAPPRIRAEDLHNRTDVQARTTVQRPFQTILSDQRRNSGDDSPENRRGNNLLRL